MTDLEPLAEYVDPDALDALLTTDGRRDDHVVVRFDYDGVAVTVRGDGTLTARTLLE